MNNYWIYGGIAVAVVVGLIIWFRKGEQAPCGYEKEQARRDAARAANAKK